MKERGEGGGKEGRKSGLEKEEEKVVVRMR